MIKKLLILVILLLVGIPAFAQVDTAWVRRYNGPDNDGDGACAIAINGSGNVYVTGSSYYSGTSTDYATIKYDPSGNELWVRRYNGPENSDDGASALAVDSSGNVYVTGGSVGSGSGKDYLTIKYFPNGDTAWVRRYNGLASSSDNAHAIALDEAGNVYVTGRSLGSGTYFDYATIKYYSNGDTAWVRRYNDPVNGDDGADAIAVDSSENVYVTGGSQGSGTGYDYATIKYYPNGDTAWVRRYNGPENSADHANAIAIDGSGNIYVSGGSVGAGTEHDYATIKYRPNGDTAWVRRYNGPGSGYGLDVAKAIALDTCGNVYVTGDSYGSGTDYDYATIKYYPNGDTAWVRRYNGPANAEDYADAIAVDSSGNVYVTGVIDLVGYLPQPGDYATIKYDPNGNEVWVRNYNGPGNEWDWARSIAVDGSGNVYVTGESRGSGTDMDYATIKYVQTPSPGTIAGTVKNASTQQNLQDVLVEALQESLIICSDYSEIEGSYNLPNLPTGFYNVRAQKPGYETKTYNGVQVTAGQTTTQDFNLNPSPADTILYDDFSGKIADWEVDGPCTWFVQDGTFGTSADGNRVFCLATAGDPTWTDYIFEADVYGIAGVDKAIEFRVQDYYNHYYVNLRSDWPNQGNDSLYFCKIVDGTCVGYECVYWPSQNNTWYHLKVEVIGKRFRAYVDDNFVLQYVDEDGTYLQGKIGLGCWTGDANICSIAFDNVLVAHQYKPFYFVHITDTHVLHTPIYPPIGKKRWLDALDRIKTWNPAPDFVICSGDLTQYGWGDAAIENWQAFREPIYKQDGTFYIDGSSIPIYFCPGNHDAADRLLYPYDFDYYHTYVGPDYYWMQHKSCAVFLLNSGKDIPSDWLPEFHSNGDGLGDQYGNEVTQLLFDLDALDGVYNGTDDSPWIKVIVAHHPYINPKNRSSDECFQYNRDPFVNACIDYEVDWVLCGHIHHGSKWGVTNRDGWPWHEDDGTKFLITNAIKDAFQWTKIYVFPIKSQVEIETGYFASTICFDIDCQATVHVYDHLGRHDGPDQNGNIEINIPGSTYSCRPADTLTMTPIRTEFSVYKEDTTDYSFVIEGLAEDTMNLAAYTYLVEGIWNEANYDSIPIHQGSVATMEANGSILDYTMTILDPDSSEREVTPSNWQGNLPPVEPTTPSGPTMVVTTDSSAYVSSSTDPENDQVFYKFDWGDSTYSDWQGPFNSGDTCLTNHRWMEAGTYNVRVRAIDEWDHMSAWSDSLSVIVRNRGDANGDGQINLADAVYLVNYLFIGGPPPDPMEAGDANCDGEVDLADAVYIVNYLFIGGPPPGC